MFSLAAHAQDTDGDGIRDVLEKGPFYVIPGTFTYPQAVADATRRGGKLATIAPPSANPLITPEFTLMQNALALWEADGVVIPYPLWIGAELDTTWKWADGTDPRLLDPLDPLSNWATDEPNTASPTYTRGRLTSLHRWEAVNPNQKGGYLLELTATDPNTLDTDGDGASDFDELFRLITDPTVPDFGAGPPVVLPPFSFNNVLVYGNYEGYLTELGKGPISGFTLSVTKTGSYTGKINGVAGSPSIRGSFTSNGLVTYLPVSFGKGLSTWLSMVIAPDPVTGIYRVSGRLNGLNGDPLVFELRRPGYSKTKPTPDAGLYTISLPADTVPKDGQPDGDGYLTGSISTAGVASLRGKTSDGLALSWSGNLLEGDFLSFFSMMPASGGFVGSNLFLRDSAVADALGGLVGQSDIDGDLRVTRKAVTSGSSQIAGYDFRSLAYGSTYQAVSYAQLPAFSEFTATQPNNALIRFIGGVFTGQDVIATWTTKNVITVPKTQTRTLSATIATSTGALTGTCTYNDPNLAYASTRGTLSAVVLQKSGEVRGCYIAGPGSGQLVVLPNLAETPAPVTIINPKSKGVSEHGAIYKIYVTASEPWSVTNLSSWVDVSPTSGAGNAELVVAVDGNSTNLRRETDLTIAGLNHHIEQDWNRQMGGVTISPSVMLVPAAGLTYTVTVTGVAAGSTAAFSSPVAWAVVTAAADLQSASVVVAASALAVSRSAILIIGGVPHALSQSPL